jgi:hypothetical protein
LVKLPKHPAAIRNLVHPRNHNAARTHDFVAAGGSAAGDPIMATREVLWNRVFDG